MSWRIAIMVGVLLSGVGCSGSSSVSATPPDAAASDPDPARGTAGSAVWFDSSLRGELTRQTFFETWGPDASAPLSQTTCWVFERSALSEDQLAALSAVKLVPLVDGCSVDGFRYFELTVVDADGSRTTYRDTGCSYLRVGGATAMFPAGLFNDANTVLGSILSDQNATKCAP